MDNVTVSGVPRKDSALWLYKVYSQNKEFEFQVRFITYKSNIVVKWEINSVCCPPIVGVNMQDLQEYLAIMVCYMFINNVEHIKNMSQKQHLLHYFDKLKHKK